MKAQHTPGPWRADDETVFCFDKEDRMIAQVRGWGWLIKNNSEDLAFETQKANLNLIAAAPELLEALENCVSLMAELERLGEIGVKHSGTYQAAKLAINKARGL